ncbi:MAG: TetR family transcriptional regulator [Methanomicrobiales archaeon HGW-Methanomicrobiales-4]|nr:MAG: TetR family transcriptional regulator [Methanomicrobiales archaeon HGW-Methanomicrobiales-4]
MQDYNSYPPSVAVKPSSSGKKEAILEVALRLFTTQGFHATPTSLISKEAGISTGTLFHYFPDKNTLFDQLYLKIKKELAIQIRSYDDPALDAKTRIERFFHGYITWGVANPEKAKFLEQFYHSPQVSDIIKRKAFAEYAWMIEVMNEAIRTGTLRDLPIDFYFVMTSQILSGVLTLISSKSTGLSDEELTASALDMIWNHKKTKDLSGIHFSTGMHI